ncbi:MAG TPA: hypothetical protein DHV36_08315 [Desulfobacteraceae bacterium]|nr:hypothetical protein [Desulfobacteraceae bacterium]
MSYPRPYQVASAGVYPTIPAPRVPQEITAMESETKKIKVTRNRRRLYENTPEDIVAAVPPAGVSTSGKADRKAVQISRQEEAAQIIGMYSKIASGSGLLPLPVVDMVAIKTVGVKMLQRLCRHYSVDYDPDQALFIINELTRGRKKLLWAGSLSKIVPILGSAGGGLAVLWRGGRIIYAVGHIMIEHFESGGTLDDFDPSFIEQ